MGTVGSGILRESSPTQVVPKYVSGWLIAPGAAEPGAGFLFAAITQTPSRLGQFDNNYRRNRPANVARALKEHRPIRSGPWRRHGAEPRQRGIRATSASPTGSVTLRCSYLESACSHSTAICLLTSSVRPKARATVVIPSMAYMTTIHNPSCRG